MYECHITAALGSFLIEELEIYGEESDWKTSYIMGDPLFGESKDYFYFTDHDEDYGVIYDRMLNMSIKLEKLGVTVARMKIEKIVYDTKWRLVDDSTS
jgi:hypothetical protein